MLKGYQNINNNKVHGDHIFETDYQSGKKGGGYDRNNDVNGMNRIDLESEEDSDESDE